jgi:hypothetical protein
LASQKPWSAHLRTWLLLLLLVLALVRVLAPVQERDPSLSSQW